MGSGTRRERRLRRCDRPDTEASGTGVPRARRWATATLASGPNSAAMSATSATAERAWNSTAHRPERRRQRRRRAWLPATWSRPAAPQAWPSVGLATASTNGTLMFGELERVRGAAHHGGSQPVPRARGWRRGLLPSKPDAGRRRRRWPRGGSSWLVVSDRSLKIRFSRSARRRRPRQAGAECRSQEWSYTAQDAAIRRVGPTAQDLHAAFGLGEDPLRVNTIDADGVALRAVQALELRDRVATADVGQRRRRGAAPSEVGRPAQSARHAAIAGRRDRGPAAAVEESKRRLGRDGEPPGGDGRRRRQMLPAGGGECRGQGVEALAQDFDLRPRRARVRASSAWTPARATPSASMRC